MVKMNATLLNLIIYIKSSVTFQNSIKMLLPETEQYPYDFAKSNWNKLPYEVFEKAGIARNNINFEDMLQFEVTEEMMNAQEKELSRFETPFMTPVNANSKPSEIGVETSKIDTVSPTGSSDSHVFLHENLGASDGHRPWINNCVEDSFS